jgi:hypothetical protein
MVLEWTTIVIAVFPHIQQFVAEKAAKIVDSKLALLYQKLAPD